MPVILGGFLLGLMWGMAYYSVVDDGLESLAPAVGRSPSVTSAKARVSFALCLAMGVGAAYWATCLLGAGHYVLEFRRGGQMDIAADTHPYLFWASVVELFTFAATFFAWAWVIALVQVRRSRAGA